MFNLFKKKYIRSDWFSGLIIAEDYVSRGYDRVDTHFYIRRLYNSKEKHGVNWPIDHPEWSGIKDYLDYYENNLK